MKVHLKHPDHGEKHAYYEAEVKEDKKNGWTEVKPEEKKTEEKKRIGRPPKQ